MGDVDDDIRRDEDGDPILTGVSITNGSHEHDELEEELIRQGW